MSAGLALRGWVGPGAERIDLAVPAGECVTVRHADPRALLARIAGLRPPRLWVRLGAQQLGRLPAQRRARAGLATAAGTLPRDVDLSVLDLLLLGRPAPGPLGFLGGLGSLTGGTALFLREREADARALAGRFALGHVLDQHVSQLPARSAPVVDAVRALLGEPRALAVALPDDHEAAAWLSQRLRAEAQRRALPILLLTTDPPG